MIDPTRLYSVYPLQITQDRSFTMPWGDIPSPDHPMEEAQIRQILEVENDRHDELMKLDYQPEGPGSELLVDRFRRWTSKDFDPRPGEVLVTSQVFKDDMRQMAPVNYPKDSAQLAMAANSQEMNLSMDDNLLSSQVRWSEGKIESVHEERGLADGSRETLAIEIDRARGLLTYSEHVGR